MTRNRVFAIAAAIITAAVVTIVSAGGSDESAEPVPTSTVPTTSVAPTTTTTTTTTTTSTTTTSTTTTVAPDVLAIERTLAALSDRDLAQQLLVLGGSGPVEVAVERGLGDVCLGGLFVTSSSDNWAPSGSLDAATAAIAGAREAGRGCAAPPLVATDAEVGTSVLRVPVDPLPSASTLEANHLADPGTTSVGLAPAAEAFAGQLADAGIDVNFGVVADVDAGDRFYMARRGRSFGADPVTVTAITEALVEGHCRAGVAPTLKHFPNQGATQEDPHEAASYSVNDPATWRTVGAVPYETTLAPLVMVGHVRYSDVDDGAPATLSPTIISGWLRGDLGYDGVVITDDLLAMRGVGGDLDPAGRAVAAVAAGADLVLFVAADEGSRIVDAIVDRMAADPDFGAQVQTSVERVLRLKGALGLLPDADPAWFPLCG